VEQEVACCDFRQIEIQFLICQENSFRLVLLCQTRCELCNVPRFVRVIASAHPIKREEDRGPEQRSGERPHSSYALLLSDVFTEGDWQRRPYVLASAFS
jgi:hypothetical protein